MLRSFFVDLLILSPLVNVIVTVRLLKVGVYPLSFSLAEKDAIDH
jgi:hypothetical protein